MQPRDRNRLLHMLASCREIQNYIASRSRADLNTDSMLTWALVKQLEIIGEAANVLSVEFKSCNAQIEWESIVGMRNRLVHVYFDVDLDIVWQTITTDIPVLAMALEQLLAQESRE